ncbi:MAG: hypothetical protein DBP02_15240 [gamma proteobacterium symbiont of Ctena orbiculata]|nr:MAG: hypothetical protein DBP02_15240 [gamma proteobacterium symbiont of Ctena orbiculata]
MKKTERSTGSPPHIVKLTTTPAAEVRLKIQREVTRLHKLSGLNAPMSTRETLIDYADVLELNAVYMAEMDNLDLQPIIESDIDMAARIRYWLA